MDALFRFASAMPRDPAVDAWLDSREPMLRDIARYWFTLLRESGDNIRELMHDGCPVACVGEVAFAYVNVFKAHVNLGFYLGATLDDPAGLLQGEGRRMRHVKIRPDKACDTASVARLIEDAYAQVAALT